MKPEMGGRVLLETLGEQYMAHECIGSFPNEPEEELDPSLVEVLQDAHNVTDTPVIVLEKLKLYGDRAGQTASFDTDTSIIILGALLHAARFHEDESTRSWATDMVSDFLKSELVT